MVWLTFVIRRTIDRRTQAKAEQKKQQQEELERKRAALAEQRAAEQRRLEAIHTTPPLSLSFRIFCAFRQLLFEFVVDVVVGISNRRRLPNAPPKRRKPNSLPPKRARKPVRRLSSFDNWGLSVDPNVVCLFVCLFRAAAEAKAEADRVKPNQSSDNNFRQHSDTRFL